MSVMVFNEPMATDVDATNDAHAMLQPPVVRRVAPIGTTVPKDALLGRGTCVQPVHQGLIDRLSGDLRMNTDNSEAHDAHDAHNAHDAHDAEPAVATGDDQPIGTQPPAVWHQATEAMQDVHPEEDRDDGFSFPPPLVLPSEPLETNDSTTSTVIADGRDFVPQSVPYVSPSADWFTPTPIIPSINPYTTKMLSYDSELAAEPLIHPARTRGGDRQLFVHYDTHAYDVKQPLFKTRVYASIDPADQQTTTDPTDPTDPTDQRPPPLCLALVIDVSPSMTDVIRSDGLSGSTFEPQSSSRSEHTLLAYAKRAARKTILDLQERARNEGRPTEVAVFVFSSTVRALCSEARTDTYETHLTALVTDITPRQLDSSKVEWFDVHDDTSVERLLRALDCVNTTGSSGTNISSALDVAGAYMTSHMLHTSKMITDLGRSVVERDYKRRVVSYDDVLATSRPAYKHGAIVLLTDGEANQGITSGDLAARHLHTHAIGNMPISVSAIALGEHVNHVFINDLLGDGHRCAFARSGAELPRAFATVMKTYDDHLRNVSIADVAIPSAQAEAHPSSNSFKSYRHVVRRHGSFQPSEEFSCLFTLHHQPVTETDDPEDSGVSEDEARAALVGHDLMRDRHAIYMAYGRDTAHTLSSADVRMRYPFEVTCCGSEQQLEQATLAATTEHYLVGQSRLQDAERRNDVVREVRRAVESASTLGAEHSLSQLHTIASTSFQNVGVSWDGIQDMCTDLASRMTSQVELERSCAALDQTLPSLNRQSTQLMCMETTRSFT